MAKTSLRLQARSYRNALTDVEHAQKSGEILERLWTEVNKINPKNIHCYVANETLREPLTMSFIVEMWRQCPKLALYVPRIADDKIESVSVTENTIFKLNRYQIPEPTDRAASVASLDVIIVPTLRFDESCRRLGYGQGYYDRFLAKYPHTLKIGLAYDADKTEVIPTEPHDIPLDMVITESQSYLRNTT